MMDINMLAAGDFVSRGIWHDDRVSGWVSDIGYVIAISSY